MATFLRQWPKSIISDTAPLRIALSGGSSLSAVNVIRNISGNTKKWELYQVDERFVPAEHADSNQKALRKILGDDLPETCHWWDTNTTIESSIAQYAHTLKADDDGNFFDITILGVGPDGHTASVFPGSMDLNTKDLVAHTRTHQFAVQERVTLTLNTLKKSKEIWVVLIGEKKQDVWEALKNNGVRGGYPASLLTEWPNVKIIWI